MISNRKRKQNEEDTKAYYRAVFKQACQATLDARVTNKKKSLFDRLFGK